MSLRALNRLRPALHYRRSSFDAGLSAAGFDVVDRIDRPQRGDLLLTWNRYAGYHDQACQFERAGGTVLVAENGWLGKHWRGGEWFSLSLGHMGQFKDGGHDRWDGWDVDLVPFRTDGEETLIFAQRGIGEPGYRSPDLWAESVRGRIGGRIRKHPGASEPDVSLADDLASAKQCVTWNSGAALQALTLGVPVWSAGPWIGAPASWPLSEWGTEPKRDEVARLNVFRKLSWGMWTLDEIRTGEPIRRLL